MTAIIEIREATSEELRTVAKLWLELKAWNAAVAPGFENAVQPDAEDHKIRRMAHALATSGAVIFLACDDGVPMGYVYLHPYVSQPPELHQVPNEGEVVELLVSQKTRSKGVGQQLMNRAYQWFHDQGITRVYVSAYAFNQVALNFYERQGFIADSILYRFDLPGAPTAAHASPADEYEHHAHSQDNAMNEPITPDEPDEAS